VGHRPRGSGVRVRLHPDLLPHGRTAAAIPRELARLKAERIELSDEWDDLEARIVKVTDRERKASAAEASVERQTRELEAARSAYEKGVISYGELATENRLLKADLANIAAEIDFQDSRHEASRQELGLAATERDRLGSAYFNEVLVSVKKSLTPGNYPSAKLKVQTAAATVRTSGVPLPALEEKQSLAQLHSQYEKAERLDDDEEGSEANESRLGTITARP
jgi:hypothetical protein